MKKIFALSVFYIIAFCSILQAGDIVGYWKSIDDKTGKAQSIVGIYEYQGKYYGKIIATYNDNGVMDDTIYAPKDKAPGVVGEPYYAGLDIIYDLKKDDTRYHGKIMDPEEGKVYSATLWTEGPDLVVRGEIWLFGRNQTWLPATNQDFPAGFKKPDLASLVPSVQQVK